MRKIIITHAVKEEFIPLSIDNCEVLHLNTGIGKTRSATLLTQGICTEKPDFVLNYGTAGTLRHNVGDIFAIDRFVDRDYETTRLPGTEFEIDGIGLIKNIPSLKEWIVSYDRTGICNTGDSFVTDIGSFNGDVIDMEAYSQAFVCRELNVPFLSVKYITDIIGQNSVELWESKLADARSGLGKWFQDHPVLSLISSVDF